MNFKRLLLTASSLAFLMGGMSASAQVEKTNANGYVGVLLGYADPTNMDGRFGYGIDAGLMFTNGLTGNIFAYSSDGDDVTITQYGLGVDYALSNWFEGFLGTLKGGLKIGMSTLDVDVPGADTESDFFFGPSIGMDHMLAQNFSVGAQADLLFTMGDTDYSMLYLWLTGKYWF